MSIDGRASDEGKGKRSIWRSRGRRFATGLNVCVAVVLAGAAMVLVDCLSLRYYMHWDIGGSDYYDLSDKTRGLLASISGEVNIVAFVRQRHEFFDDIRNLLKEYEYEADGLDNLDLNIEIVDPDRDVARAKQLSAEYELDKADVIVVEADSRKKYIEADSLVDIERIIDGKKMTVEKKRGAFSGEQVFSSAILSVTQKTRPVIYFLTGHGERDIKEFGKQSGYTTIARVMQRDNMDVRPLLLAASHGVPEDCSAIVIAGPDRRIPDAEIDVISDYLAKKGRLFVLVDPATTTGLDKLLREWGVGLSKGVVIDPAQTLSGSEVVVNRYGDHPVTRSIQDDATMFYMPRAIDGISGRSLVEEVAADEPRVYPLAATTDKGWVEMDLNQNPPRMNPDVDRPGPVCIAVAVEKGPVSGLDVEIKPTRIVVVGDSLFVSNEALKSTFGANRDLFMSAVNWLVEREALMGIAPRTPSELRLDMDRARLRLLFLIAVAGVPAIVAVVGICVWFRRRA